MIKSIKSSFMFKFFILLVLLLIPSSVNASYYYPDDFIAILYDNINGSLTVKSAELENGSWNGRVGLTAYSSGAAWGFNLATPIIEGHTYTLSVNFSTSNQSSNDIIFSSVNRIGLGTTFANAKSSYENSTNTELIYTNNVNSQLQFAFKAKTSGSYLVVPFATPYSISIETVYFSGYVLEDLGTSSNISQDTINSSLNNQTNEINNSITNSENNIKDSINSTEGNLKDSIKETEDNIKDGIKEGFETCRDSYNLLNNVAKSTTISGITFTINNDGSVTVNGTATYNAKLILTNYFNLDVGDYKLIEGNSDYLDTAIRGTYNDSNGNLKYLSSSSNKFTVASGFYNYQIYIVILQGKTVNNLTFYPMLVKYENRNISYEKYGEQVCKNRIDDTNDKLNDLNDSINSDDVNDSTSAANNFFNGFETNTFGLTSIITSPLTLIGSITSSTCSPLGLKVPFLKDTTLNLPCMSAIYSQYFGTFLTIYQTITFGIVAYWVSVKIFALVKDFKNPDNDKVEVLDL